MLLFFLSGAGYSILKVLVCTSGMLPSAVPVIVDVAVILRDFMPPSLVSFPHLLPPCLVWSLFTTAPLTYTNTQGMDGYFTLLIACYKMWYVIQSEYHDIKVIISDYFSLLFDYHNTKYASNPKSNETWWHFLPFQCCIQRSKGEQHQSNILTTK